MQKVSENCQKAWDKFKQSADTRSIINVVNNDTQVYFNTGFRMQFPKGFKAPLMREWYRIRDNVKVLPMDEGTYNANKQFLESEEDYKQHFYRNFYDPDEDDFLPAWEKKIFVITTGKEIIGKEEITAMVDFLANYNSQIESIGKDIDTINISNRNLKNMLSNMPANESFKMIEGINEIINEIGIKMIGTGFKNPDDIKTSIIDKHNKALAKEQNRLRKREAKNDKKYIMTYYMSSMDIISSKIKICNTIRVQNLKIAKKYIALQPKEVGQNPAAAEKYTATQTRRNNNPNFQIRK
jgi:hypothetical protein